MAEKESAALRLAVQLRAAADVTPLVLSADSDEAEAEPEAETRTSHTGDIRSQPAPKRRSRQS